MNSIPTTSTNSALLDSTTEQNKKYIYAGKQVSRSYYFKMKKKAKMRETELRRPVKELYAKRKAEYDWAREKINIICSQKLSHLEESSSSNQNIIVPEPYSNKSFITTPDTWSSDIIPSEEMQCDSPSVIDTVQNMVENDHLQKYRIPEPVNSEPLHSSLTPIQKCLYELHTIFVVNNVTTRCQNDLLHFIRNLSPDMLSKFPRDFRTLRPPLISHTIRLVPPGKMIYFGIANVLRMPGIHLFDKSVNEIRLSTNIDGLPIYRSSNCVGFWPILGSIDQFPVFLIGFYEGIKKPVCSNDFLKDFVAEVNEWQLNGITVNNIVYRFKLEKILLDAPAMAYVTGIIGHGGKNPCSKCLVEGESVVLNNGLRKDGKEKKTIRFLDIDAEPRHSSDFNDHYDMVDDPHLVSDFDNHDTDDSVYSTEYLQELSKHHKHPTSLTTINQFDIVKDIPLDYLHLVCLGVVKRLLKMWTEMGPYKMTNQSIEAVSQRLIATHQYWPREFQRKCDSLEHLSSWKGTQFRTFLLYVGVVVLDGHLNEEYLSNFQLLVVCMRVLTCQIDRNSSTCSEILKQRGQRVKDWIRRYVRMAINLYTSDFAIYNVHNLIHAPDDYMRFGPIDQYSCFKYESFLCRLKKLVAGHYEPGMQVINKYSSLLQTQQFGKQGRQDIDYFQEYFEVPDLLYPIDDNDLTEDHIEHGRSTKDSIYELYKVMRFKNFTIIAGKESDCYCVTKNKYMKVMKIQRNKLTHQIDIVGHIFQCINNIFSLPSIRMASTDVGMVTASDLSKQLYTYGFEDISQKCLAIPHSSTSCTDHTCRVIARYLH